MLAFGSSSYDRRNRKTAARKAAQSSKVSLLSNVTGTSSGSSGSGSTITQESISRQRARNVKGNMDLKGKRQKTTTSKHSTDARPRRTKSHIDVFDFLDKDESRVSLSRRQGQSASITQEGSHHPAQDDSDLESNPNSFHSDSGISINDSPTDEPRQKSYRSSRRRLETLDENPLSHELDAENEIGRDQALPQSLRERPEWYYGHDSSPSHSPAPATPGTGSSSASSSVSSSPSTSSSSSTAAPRSGYDLLANRLSFPIFCSTPASSSSPPCSVSNTTSAALPPLYRRFTALNHRILLQLQDEIAEMEEDLQILDDADAQERSLRHESSDGDSEGSGSPGDDTKHESGLETGNRTFKTVPAKRRIDWQQYGSDLHHRRLHLLGQIHQKVEQYNQALTSFTNVSTTTTPAQPIAIKTYREWMTTYNPIAETETKYLRKEGDLLALSHTGPPNPATPNALGSSDLGGICIAISLLTAVPILLFRVVSAFSSRVLLLSMVIGSIGVCMQNRPEVMNSLTGVKMVLGVYLSLLLGCALVL